MAIYYNDFPPNDLLKVLKRLGKSNENSKMNLVNLIDTLFSISFPCVLKKKLSILNVFLTTNWEI